MSETINLHLDLPSTFAVKAEYALRAMLAGFDINVQQVNRETLQQSGGIFYGLAAGEPVIGSRGASNGVLALISHPETWAYFEKNEGSPPIDDNKYPTLEELTGQTGEAKKFLKEIRQKLENIKASADISTDVSGLEWPEKTPFLFGNTRSESGTRYILTEADLVASSFFWLSDWQETYMGEEARDEHGRIPYSRSLHSELGLGALPIVDVYGLLLIHWLRKLGYQCIPKLWPGGKRFALFLTFDIDNLRKNPAALLWRESRNLFRRQPNPPSPQNSNALLGRVSRFRKVLKQLPAGDENLTSSVDRILEICRENEGSPTIFLKSLIERHRRDARDYLDIPYFNKMLDNIESLDGEIGFHSSYRANYDRNLFRKELLRLTQKTNREINAHRAHYLRYDNSLTPELWENHGLTADSSMGWADQFGFRTGTCHPHYIFNRKRNSVTDIIEIPLMAMDAQLFGYMELTGQDALKRLEIQVKLVELFRGILVWNFHQHIFDSLEAPGWGSLFKKAYQRAAAEKPWQATFRDLTTYLTSK